MTYLIFLPNQPTLKVEADAIEIADADCIALRSANKIVAVFPANLVTCVVAESYLVRPSIVPSQAK